MNIISGDCSVISKKITQTVAEGLDYEDFVKITASSMNLGLIIGWQASLIQTLLLPLRHQSV